MSDRCLELLLPKHFNHCFMTVSLIKNESFIENDTLKRKKMECTSSPTLDGDSPPSNGLVIEALRTHISSIDTDTCEAGEEDSFFVADLDEVYRQHLRWKTNLKRVTPHYGMNVT